MIEGSELSGKLWEFLEKADYDGAVSYACLGEMFVRIAFQMGVPLETTQYTISAAYDLMQGKKGSDEKGA